MTATWSGFPFKLLRAWAFFVPVPLRTVKLYGKAANFANSSCQTPRMDSGATIRTLWMHCCWYRAPVMAMAVRLFPVPIRYISIKRAQP
jgi:hypothetical protein